MTYYESAEGTVITRQRAITELARHAIDDPSEFFAECGDNEYYDAQDVLNWLGY